MNGNNQVLICTVCDYYLGFEVRSIRQIIHLKYANIIFNKGRIDFRGKNIPYVNIFQFLNCNENEGKFVLILEQKKGLFSTSVSGIEGIITYEADLGEEVAQGLKNFVLENYAKRLIIFNELPVVVVDTEKLVEKVFKESKKDKGKSETKMQDL